MIDVNRRSFVGGLVSFAGLGLLQESVAQTSASSSSATVTLEDERVRVVFDRHSGALMRHESKQTGWQIQNAAAHFSGFRLHVPLPNRSAHFVTEENNPLVDLKVAPDGKSLEMTWAQLRTPHAGILDITVHASLTLTQAGLVSNCVIDNRSTYHVNSISFPIYADLRAPGNGQTLEVDNWFYGGMGKNPLLPNWPNGAGYWGVDYPTFIANNWIPWNFILVAGEQEGFYVGVHEPALKDKVMFEFQLQPGYVNSFDVNAIDSATKHSTRISMEVVQFFFAGPQSRKSGQTILLSPYRGTWHTGVDVYKKWRSTWWRAPISPAWAEDVVSWQQIQINSSEDRLLFPYKDLPIYAADCANYGVKAIQLTGWNIGGQDRAYPNHDVDPRLGTAEDLRNAIDQCRKMGVEIILFNKYVYSDITTDWWKRELYSYAAIDPYGMPYGLGGGDQYDTPTQLSDINTRRLAVMCTSCKEWQQIAKREFMKNVDLHASGILYDEVCHHGPAHYCFSPDHGHPVPSYLYSSDVPFAENLRQAVDPTKFLFAGEAPYDQELTCYRVYYTRISSGHIAIQRYIDPQLPIMVAVTGTNDRLMLNRALMHRYNISYEPRNFKGRLSEIPLVMAYGSKIDTLRRRYRQFLWDGDYRDSLDVKVTGDKEHQPLFSVFVDRASGKRAVVITNELHNQAITTTIEIPNSSRLVLATPENPTATSTSPQIVVPPESATVVMES